MPSRRSLFRALFVLPFLPLARMLGTAKAHDAGLGGYLLPDHLAKDAVRDMNSAIAPGLFNTTQVVATPTTPIGTLDGVPLHTNWPQTVRVRDTEGGPWETWTMAENGFWKDEAGEYHAFVPDEMVKALKGAENA